MSITTKTDRFKEPIVVPNTSFAVMVKYLNMDVDAMINNIKSVERGENYLVVNFPDMYIYFRKVSNNITVVEAYFHRAMGMYSGFATLRCKHERTASHEHIYDIKLMKYRPKGTGYELADEVSVDEDAVFKSQRSIEGFRRQITYRDVENLLKKFIRLSEKLQ